MKYEMQNVWVSAWGSFLIPKEVFLKTHWKRDKRDTIVGALPIPENWEFFKWLDDAEREAGKK